MPDRPLAPPPTVGLAPVDFDASGRAWSPVYGDVYRSRAGALDEANAVFIDGCRLPGRWAGQPAFTIVETGFGLGINFLVTLARWRADPARPAQLHFVSIEAHPVDGVTLSRALEAAGLKGPDADALCRQWPLPLPGLHRLRLAGGAVTLTLAFGDALRMAERLRVAADAFFLDGFSPARNPRMWSPALMKALARLARPGATLATYTAAGAVRDALADAGFEVSRVPGFGSKRERLDAHYAPAWRTYPAPPPPPRWCERAAVVVGGGLSGCFAAATLARRGWRVSLIEAAPRIVSQGSGQPVVADHLHVSPDDNPLARLTRAALLARHDPAPIGKVQVADHEADEARLHGMVELLGFPRQFVQALDADAASDAAGVRLARGGLWLPLCGATSPAAAGAAALAAGGDAIALRTGRRVERIAHVDGRWWAFDADGVAIDAAPVMLLANAGDATRLAGLDSAALRRVRGQTTVLPGHALPGLRAAIGGDAYACPLSDGDLLVGSTFDDGEDLAPTTEADESNLRRLARMLSPQAWDPTATAPRRAAGTTGFRFTPRDRLPLVGAMPDEAAVRSRAAEHVRNDRLPLPRREGLYGAFAYGARGMLWAGLAAEVLADALEGTPMPIESDLLDAIDPARFLRGLLRTRRLR